MNTAAPALLTDFYQLTMAQGYFAQHMTGTAVFEFFVRKLPAARNFLVAAGLEQVLAFLETFRFSREELDWLSEQNGFRPDFITHLASLRFTGDVDAMPEGTVFFSDEPVLRVTAPIDQAQLVETRVIQLLHFQTLIASKAARVVLAARGKRLVDFGLRRTHGAEAGLLAARASYIAGFDATSNVEAGRTFEIPVSGTMAHSFIEAHDDEWSAFEHFAAANPERVVLLLDTYDTEAAAEKAVVLGTKLKQRGIAIAGVRLDSGDLVQHAQRVRKILNEGLLTEAEIFASGNIDEFTVQHVLEERAPIDGFGVGTRMGTSADAPYLDCAYKLMEYAGRARRKSSEGKATWPGRKQVWRMFEGGLMASDTVTLERENVPGSALIEPVMRGGKRLAARASLPALREYAAAQLAQLPAPLRSISAHAPFPVTISSALQELAADVDVRADLAATTEHGAWPVAAHHHER